MEGINLNSNLEWKIGLYTPVDLGCSFKLEDLIGSGINLDSKITILESNGITLPRKSLLNDIADVLGEDFEDIISLCSREDDERKVLDFFDLRSIDGEDSDYVILQLKEGNEIYNKVKLLRKGLSVKYDLNVDRRTYIPHIVLAEVKKGAARKYTFSGNLKLILNDSLVDLEDFALQSSTLSGEKRTYYLTHFKNLDRFFRIHHLKEDQDDLMKDDI